MAKLVTVDRYEGLYRSLAIQLPADPKELKGFLGAVNEWQNIQIIFESEEENVKYIKHSTDLMYMNELMILDEQEKVMNTPKMKVVCTNSKGFKPATAGSAGYDLYPQIDGPVEIEAGKVVILRSGIAIEGNPGYAFMVMPRSGLGTRGLVLANTVGLIDSDFASEISIPLWNRTNKTIVIMPDVAVAQGIFIPVAHPAIEFVDAIEQTGRGGFGSTGM